MTTELGGRFVQAAGIEPGDSGMARQRVTATLHLRTNRTVQTVGIEPDDFGLGDRRVAATLRLLGGLRAET